MKNKNYSVVGSLVKDHVEHWSYNLTNQKDAIKLCEKLNNQEKQLQQFQECTERLNELTIQLNEANKQLKQVIMSSKILQNDLEKLKNKLEEME